MLSKRPEAEVLRDRVEELEETVRQLRNLLGADGAMFPASWGLSVQQSAFLRCLYRANDGCRTYPQLAHAIQRGTEPVTDQAVSVVCCNVRKKVKPLGIEIVTRWGVGFQLAQGSKDIVAKALAS